MYPDHNAAIADILKLNEALSAEQLESIVQEQERSDKSLAQTAVDSGSLSLDELLAEVASYLDWPFEQRLPLTVSIELISSLEGRLAHMYGVIPYKEEGYELQLLAIDPFNNAIIEDLSFALNRDITLVVGDPQGIRDLIETSYGKEKTSVKDALDEVRKISEQEGDDWDIEALAEEAPVIRFVNLVLEQAVRDKASDIHFEPFEDVFRIRYRVDGSLYEMSPSPVNLALPVI